jgi:hypothetical protein
MSKLAAALLVRIGLVLLVLAVLARFLPMPDRADAVADEFAIAVSLMLVVVASAYLRLTRQAPGAPGPVPGNEPTHPDSSYPEARRHR